VAILDAPVAMTTRVELSGTTTSMGEGTPTRNSALWGGA
jgi:hypothetical protein